MLNVQDLHRALGQLIEMGMGESELRFAYQPNYPLQDKIDGLWFNQEEQDEAEEGDGEAEPPCVYLVSGGQDYNNPYAPRQAFEESTTQF